jgi:hypothetical protein
LKDSTELLQHWEESVHEAGFEYIPQLSQPLAERPRRLAELLERLYVLKLRLYAGLNVGREGGSRLLKLLLSHVAYGGHEHPTLLLSRRVAPEYILPFLPSLLHVLRSEPLQHYPCPSHQLLTLLHVAEHRL